MRTPKENPKTREMLLDTAQHLMLAKGYTATSVEEICEGANLTKGSFFHYFESKEELGKAVLDRFMLSMVEAALSSPLLKKKNPLERVYGHIDFIIEVSKDPERSSGCLLGNFAQVLSDTNPEIRLLCDKHFRRWAGMLKHELDEARKIHAAKKPIDTEVLAEHFIALFEGSLILAKTRRDVSVIERNLRNFKKYLKSLFE